MTWSDFSRKRYQKNVFFKQKLFSFPMKNSVNQYSVELVSFECIDEKGFRFFQIDHMIHLKRQFSKNFFFLEKVGPVRTVGPVCGTGLLVFIQQYRKRTNAFRFDI